MLAPDITLCTLYTQTKEMVNDGKVVQQKKRLKSLDTFRGFSMAILIFVNDGAAGWAKVNCHIAFLYVISLFELIRYYFFEHAIWNGLYVADLAFPW